MPRKVNSAHKITSNSTVDGSSISNNASSPLNKERIISVLLSMISRLHLIMLYQDALIRAGKREFWKWEVHEVFELRRRLCDTKSNSQACGQVFLWAFDDLCMSHTKRRVLDISALEGSSEIESIVRSVAEDTEESLAGLKRTLRSILQVCVHCEYSWELRQLSFK